MYFFSSKIWDKSQWWKTTLVKKWTVRMGMLYLYTRLGLKYKINIFEMGSLVDVFSCKYNKKKHNLCGQCEIIQMMITMHHITDSKDNLLPSVEFTSDA